MSMESWKYYNHAAVPTAAPHEMPDLEPVENGTIWKGFEGDKPLLARWTEDWDCGYETDFWYVIKDTAFDISKLKSKRRYEINKGKKNFDVRIIEPGQYKNEIFNIAEKAFGAYPMKYRPTLDRAKFIEEIETKWKDYTVFGAFGQDAELLGYAYLLDYDNYSDFLVLKADPAEERNAINAAIVNGICEKYQNKLLQPGFYICDGSRPIRHETQFQDYLEKYFEFRKAYCTLHIKYRFPFGLGVSLLKPFTKILSKSSNSFLYNISSILKMESYCDN